MCLTWPYVYAYVNSHQAVGDYHQTTDCDSIVTVEASGENALA